MLVMLLNAMVKRQILENNEMVAWVCGPLSTPKEDVHTTCRRKEFLDAALHLCSVFVSLAYQTGVPNHANCY